MDELLELLQRAVPHVDWRNEDDLIGRGRLDSLDVFALIGELGANYGIRILPEDILPEHFSSAGAIRAFLAKYL